MTQPSCSPRLAALWARKGLPFPVPLPLSFLLTWSLSAKPLKSLPLCTAPRGPAESHSPPRISVTVCLRSSHPRPCTALDSCQLLGSVKHPLLQTSPFLWDLQGPPQARWNRQAGQGGHQAQLKCPLVFRAHGHSRPPALPPTPKGHQFPGFNLLGPNQQLSPSVTFLLFQHCPSPSSPVIKTVQLCLSCCVTLGKSPPKPVSPLFGDGENELSLQDFIVGVG